MGVFLRMSRDWDAAHIATPLGAFRVHGGSTTAAHGRFTGSTYDQPDSHFELVRDVRLRTIVELGLPPTEANALRRIALKAHRKAIVGNAAAAAGTSSRRLDGVRALRELAARDPQVLLVLAHGGWSLRTSAAAG